LFSGWTIRRNSSLSNDHYFSYAFSLHSWNALANQKFRFRKLCGLIASQESVLEAINKNGLVQWPCAARSTTCEQDRYVCDFAYLVMKI
jgi:hypothetical protein